MGNWPSANRSGASGPDANGFLIDDKSDDSQSDSQGSRRSQKEKRGRAANQGCPWMHNLVGSAVHAGVLCVGLMFIVDRVTNKSLSVAREISKETLCLGKDVSKEALSVAKEISDNLAETIVDELPDKAVPQLSKIGLTGSWKPFGLRLFKQGGEEEIKQGGEEEIKQGGKEEIIPEGIVNKRDEP